jgi:hypothetical protein
VNIDLSIVVNVVPEGRFTVSEAKEGEDAGQLLPAINPSSSNFDL